jgi:hypothetical protein
MVTISNSVGRTGPNRPVDVMIVQHLLNLNYDVADYQTPITGTLDNAMIQAINRFQRNALAMKTPDGQIAPGGITFRRLANPGLGWIMGAPPAVRAPIVADPAPAVRAGIVANLRSRNTYEVLRSVIGASRQSRVATRPGEASSSLSIINDGALLKLYDLQFGRLGAAQRAGLTKLIDYINRDPEILDVGWCAYMLATVKRECMDKWQPIREVGRGAGHTYGNPAPYIDAQGRRYANIYYGRGYAQLTWLINYRTLGQALGLGDELAINPDRALDPDIAYPVLSYGMRNGSFEPGHKLSTYINAIRCDYVAARWIINRNNVAALIAGYALDLEMLLRVSCDGSFSDSPARAFVGKIPMGCR